MWLALLATEGGSYLVHSSFRRWERIDELEKLPCQFRAVLPDNGKP